MAAITEDVDVCDLVDLEVGESGNAFEVYCEGGVAHVDTITYEFTGIEVTASCPCQCGPTWRAAYRLDVDTAYVPEGRRRLDTAYAPEGRRRLDTPVYDLYRIFEVSSIEGVVRAHAYLDDLPEPAVDAAWPLFDKRIEANVDRGECFPWEEDDDDDGGADAVGVCVTYEARVPLLAWTTRPRASTRDIKGSTFGLPGDGTESGWLTYEWSEDGGERRETHRHVSFAVAENWIEASPVEGSSVWHTTSAPSTTRPKAKVFEFELTTETHDDRAYVYNVTNLNVGSEFVDYGEQTNEFSGVRQIDTSFRIQSMDVDDLPLMSTALVAAYLYPTDGDDDGCTFAYTNPDPASTAALWSASDET